MTYWSDIYAIDSCLSFKYKTTSVVLKRIIYTDEIFNDLSVHCYQNQDGFEVLPTIDALKDDYSRVNKSFTAKRGDITH